MYILFKSFFFFLNNFLGFCSLPDIFFSSPNYVYGHSLQRAYINKGFFTYGLLSSSPALVIATKKGFVGCVNEAGFRLAPLKLVSIVQRAVSRRLYYIYLSSSSSSRAGMGAARCDVKQAKKLPFGARGEGSRDDAQRGRRWLWGPPARCCGCSGVMGSLRAAAVTRGRAHFPRRSVARHKGHSAAVARNPARTCAPLPAARRSVPLKIPRLWGGFHPPGGSRAARGALQWAALQWDPVSSSSGRFWGGFAAGAAPKVLAEHSGQVPGGLGYPHSAGGTRGMKYPRCLGKVFRLGRPSPALSPFPG